MDNLKKCAHILSEDIIKANRPKLKLDIFPDQVESAKTSPQPQLDSFDSAVNRALNGEPIRQTKTVTQKPTARRILTFDEAVKERLG